jgi:hypothetical protein
LRAYTDAANHRWNVWVLQYSQQQQMSLLRDWGFDSPDWVTLVRICATLLAGLALAGLAWLWWQRPRLRRSDWHAPLMRIHQKLLSSGFSAPAGCPAPAPALTWARAIENQTQTGAGAHIELVSNIVACLERLDALRYGPDRADTRQQRRALCQETLRLIDRWAQRDDSTAAARRRN